MPTVPATALRQFLTDLLVVVWVYVWVRLGMRLFDLIQKLAVPGQKLEGAGNGLADNLKGAGDKIDGVPGVPDSVAAPFDSAATRPGRWPTRAASSRRSSTTWPGSSSVMLVAVPLALVVFVWLPLRIRWMRRAGSAAETRAAPTAGRDLLALRALATQPLGRLVKIDPEIAALWRKGDKHGGRGPRQPGTARLGLR